MTMNITIETEQGGKRAMEGPDAIRFLATLGTGEEVMVDGELWTRFGYDDGDEYKVSPHANLEGGDYDKDCRWVTAEEDDIRDDLEDAS